MKKRKTIIAKKNRELMSPKTAQSAGDHVS
jgi:hypothetical protein